VVGVQVGRVVVVVGVQVGRVVAVAVVAVGAERGGEVENVRVRALELAQRRREERLGVLDVQGSRVSHWPQHHALHLRLGNGQTASTH